MPVKHKNIFNYIVLLITILMLNLIFSENTQCKFFKFEKCYRKGTRNIRLASLIC